MKIKEEWLPEAIQFAVDEESGAVIEQLTSEPVTSTNIYCEQRFASHDGTRIAISRKPFDQPTQIWVCDLRSLKVCKAVVGDPVGATSPLNAVYYTAENKLMLLDLKELIVRELFDFDGKETPKVVAVSPDQRYFVGGPFEVRDTIFSLKRYDLLTGEENVLCEVEDMFNPHLQFASSGPMFNIQINRGGTPPTKSGGQKVKRIGASGATLVVGNVETGDITSMPIGKPHTPSISGHEAWIGDTGIILFSAGFYNVSASSFVTIREPDEILKEMPSAALYSAAPGDEKPTIVATGLLFNHLAVSDDGNFFIADDHTSGDIYIGRIDNGNYKRLCASSTRQGACQHSHVHPYMTPDNQYVIFNSVVTGCAQVYAAKVPEGFLDEIC